MQADLDQSGNLLQKVNAYLGPSLGWSTLLVLPESFITTGPTYIVQPYDSRVLLNSIAIPITSVLLPDVSDWVRRPAFDRSLWIKDFAYLAQANNITITPFGTQKIDELPQFTIITSGLLIRLYPLSDLTGWFVG